MSKPNTMFMPRDDDRDFPSLAPDPALPKTIEFAASTQLAFDRLERALVDASVHLSEFRLARGTGDMAGLERAAIALAATLTETDLGPLARVIARSVTAQRKTDTVGITKKE